MKFPCWISRNLRWELLWKVVWEKVEEVEEEPLIEKASERTFPKGKMATLN